MSDSSERVVQGTSAYYQAAIADFISESATAVIGQLARSNEFALDATQRDAWLAEIAILQEALRGMVGTIFLEFEVPRLGTRIDAVVIAGPAVFPIEFKIGQERYVRTEINQAWDYGLDLKNFHAGSHDAPIFPILVASEAPDSGQAWAPPHEDGVRPPINCNGSNLRRAIDLGLTLAQGPTIDGTQWSRAPYRPTPTIIEAAQALYARHGVDSISRSDAGARNLSVTSAAIDEVIETARDSATKAIVFVTGVPGAGKTLVGLNIATKRADKSMPTHAVFLSGNGPLVSVLQEALVRDEMARRVKENRPARKGALRQPVKQFIQNVHHFRDAGVRNPELAPHDHVVIFDEAQRAWNVEKTSDFMKRRKGLSSFDQSEPEFLISYMDRHESWSVIICLVGGGQEIHTGEAGIGTWLTAVSERFPNWQMHVSPFLKDSEYAAAAALQTAGPKSNIVFDERLHLSVSMRSFRSENVSAFVKALLDRDLDGAKQSFAQVSAQYPIAVTRDLGRARAWIRSHARGSERYGLVASSQAQRLKPHAIDVRVKIDPVHWFLNDASDTRSSFYLEDAATEFQIQGLELDWICVTWDADLRMANGHWRHHAFRGDAWTTMHKSDRKQFLLNAYRVLLTRARQGMVIFVPPGESTDPTRLPAFYDETSDYLTAMGIPMV